MERQAQLIWQLDERGARDYEANLVPALMDRGAQDLLARVPPRPGDAVLDVGTGTGIVARRAAPMTGAAGRVDGIDVNPAMLALARQLAADHRGVRFLRAPAEELPFDDAAFDLALAHQVLQFTDAPRALAQMRRVLRPRGRLGVATCRAIRHQPGYRVLAERIEEHLGADAAGIIRSPYALGDPGAVERLVSDAGFAEVATRITVTAMRFPSPAAFLRAETSSSPLGNIAARRGEDVIAGLVADLERHLAPHTDSDGVVFPFETISVTAVADR